MEPRLVSFRGISGIYNNNLVDGVSNEQALFAEARGRASGAPYVFPSDAIKEFESSVSGYSAELGGAAGGVVNAITKSGTNSIHGDLYYLLRYPDLNALDPYSKWSWLHNAAIRPWAHRPSTSSSSSAQRGRPHHQGQALLLLQL